jgi:hypothetical protein
LTDRTSQQLCYNQRRRDRGMFVEDTTWGDTYRGLCEFAMST